MRNPINTFLKQYFNYTKSDRNAIIVLVILILFGIVVNEIIKHSPAKSKYDYFKFAKELEELENNLITNNFVPKKLFEFNPNIISEQELDSLLIPDFVKKNLLSYRNAGGNFSEPSDLNKLYGMNDSIFQEIESYIVIPKKEISKPIKSSTIETKPEGNFDPNIADKETLLYFGLNEFQAENILRYRNSGGKFHAASDLLVIYGIDTLLLKNIMDYVLINEMKSSETPRVKKKILVELNSADSVQLVQLNGIGPAFASRILKYRELLGGYNNREQLLEVYNFPEETYQMISGNINVDSMKVKKIRINFAQYGEFIRHPYFDQEMINSILSYREKNGAFENISQLINVSGIDSTIYRRISPYITCR